jgi:RHH-type proline utilization regulon transcriptional repressor/proline dehydrogenase/delta 1-pyrroline-5-carboxylate dehydrogenase
VVESQPFGGEGLRALDRRPAARINVARVANGRVTCIDTTAAGGNASFMAAIDG